VVIATDEASLYPDCVVDDCVDDELGHRSGIDECVDVCVDDELGHRYVTDSELESLLSLIDTWLPRLYFGGGGALKRAEFGDSVSGSGEAFGGGGAFIGGKIISIAISSLDWVLIRGRTTRRQVALN